MIRDGCAGEALRALAASLLVALPTGCATDATGDRSLSIVNEGDVMIRASSAAGSWRDRWGVYREPELLARVLEVARKVARAAGPPADEFRFEILDADWENAAAFPDGSIFVTRGMLALLTSEHELALLLGHEIAHVMARHTLEAMNRDSVIAGAAILGSALGLLDAVEAVMLPSYSRQAESEADALGARYATAAGYDVRCGGLFFVAFERLSARREVEQDFFSSHPAPADRHARLGSASVDRKSCEDGWSDRIYSLRREAAGQDFFTIGERTFVMPRIGLQVTVPERPLGPKRLAAVPSKFIPGRGADQPPVIAMRDPEMYVYVDHYAPGVTTEWAREHAARPRGTGKHDSRVESLDLAPLGERQSVRLVRSRDIGGIRLRFSEHWVEDSGVLFLVEVRARASEWDKVEPIARAIAESVRRVDPGSLGGARLEGRIHYHELDAEETLATLVERYPDWDAEELAIYNSWPEGHVPAVGERVKVVRRDPVDPERFALLPGRQPLHGDLEAQVSSERGRAAARLADRRIEGLWILDPSASRLFPHGVQAAELRLTLAGDDVEVERRSMRLGKEESVIFRYRTDDAPHEIAADGGPHEYTSFGRPRTVRALWRGDRLEVSYGRQAEGRIPFEVKEIWRVRGKERLEVKTTYSARYGSATTREIYLRR